MLCTEQRALWLADRDRKAHLLLKGRTDISLFTLSIVPQTVAVSLPSCVSCVPCPLHPIVQAYQPPNKPEGCQSTYRKNKIEPTADLRNQGWLYLRKPDCSSTPMKSPTVTNADSWIVDSKLKEFFPPNLSPSASCFIDTNAIVQDMCSETVDGVLNKHLVTAKSPHFLNRKIWQIYSSKTMKVIRNPLIHHAPLQIRKFTTASTYTKHLIQ